MINDQLVGRVPTGSLGRGRLFGRLACGCWSAFPAGPCCTPLFAFVPLPPCCLGQQNGHVREILTWSHSVKPSYRRDDLAPGKMRRLYDAEVSPAERRNRAAQPMSDQSGVGSAQREIGAGLAERSKATSHGSLGCSCRSTVPPR